MRVIIKTASDPMMAAKSSIGMPEIRELVFTGQAKEMFMLAVAACCPCGHDHYLGDYEHILGIPLPIFFEENNPRFLAIVGSRVWFGLKHPMEGIE